MAGSTSDEGRPYFFQSAISDPHTSHVAKFATPNRQSLLFSLAVQHMTLFYRAT